MRAAVVSAILVFLVSGCQTPQNAADPEIYGRSDCKRGAANPEVARQYELDLEVCRHRGAATGEASATPLRGGGILGALDRAVTEGSVSRSTQLACMAERGYLMRKKSEHDARCAKIADTTLPLTKIGR